MLSVLTTTRVFEKDKLVFSWILRFFCNMDYAPVIVMTLKMQSQGMQKREEGTVKKMLETVWLSIYMAVDSLAAATCSKIIQEFIIIRTVPLSLLSI